MWFDQADLERLPSDPGPMYVAVARHADGRPHYFQGGFADANAALAKARQQMFDGGIAEAYKTTDTEWLRWVGGAHTEPPGTLVETTDTIGGHVTDAA